MFKLGWSKFRDGNCQILKNLKVAINKLKTTKLFEFCSCYFYKPNIKIAVDNKKLAITAPRASLKKLNINFCRIF